MMVYLKNVVSLQFDPKLCSGCGACMMNCPVDAITVDAGVGCASAILNGMLRNSEPSCDCGSNNCC